MTKALSIAEAKARFSHCVRAAELGEPIVITRHGRRVVALVPAKELDHLARLRALGPEGGLAGLAGGWRGSEALADLIARTPRTSRKRTPRRR